MAQIGRIEILRRDIEELKITPIFNKAEKAEKIINKIVDLLAELDTKINQLGVKNVN